MTVWAVVVAGGSGERYRPGANKLLEDMGGGHCVLSMSASALWRHPQVQALVVVCHPAWQSAYGALLSDLASDIDKPLTVVAGGKTRRDSVFAGLQAVPNSVDVVLIHDAARPLVSFDSISAVIAPILAGDTSAASLGTPSVNSLKQVQSPECPQVAQTLDRSVIWQVHTPQAFKRQVLLEAHHACPVDPAVNDDAELVERMTPDQSKVLMVRDWPGNIKITAPEDLLVARALHQSQVATSVLSS